MIYYIFFLNNKNLVGIRIFLNSIKIKQFYCSNKKMFCFIKLKNVNMFPSSEDLPME